VVLRYLLFWVFFGFVGVWGWYNTAFCCFCVCIVVDGWVDFAGISGFGRFFGIFSAFSGGFGVSWYFGVFCICVI